MRWQEYQEAVALFYEQLDSFGKVHRSVTIPDKVTGQRRQIDVLVEIEAYGHTIQIVVDAKFHADKIDVKTVEEVIALANAVNASQAVIVAANGWTEPAAKKAEFANLTLRLLPLEDALDLLVPDKWEMCPNCHQDCIVLDMDGAVVIDGLINWWIAGKCRECKFGFIWCQECGDNLALPFNEEVTCYCGHLWCSKEEGLFVKFSRNEDLEE